MTTGTTQLSNCVSTHEHLPCKLCGYTGRNTTPHPFTSNIEWAANSSISFPRQCNVCGVIESRHTPTPATTQTERIWRCDRCGFEATEAVFANKICDAPTPTQEQHTATPWRVADSDMDLDGDSCVELYYQDATEARVTAYVPDYDAQGEIDAAFIVKAVNSHEKLVAALRQIRDHVSAAFESDGEEFVSENDLLNWCDDALAEVQDA